jgi:hypothetical protein
VPTRTVSAKAQRLINENRVHLMSRAGRKAVYSIRGDTGVHKVTLWDDGSFICDCRARAECSHVIAAKRLESAAA